MTVRAPQRVLEGRRVLLLEDDLLQAQDVEQALKHGGAIVMGPYSSESVAMRQLDQDDSVSCAILDIQIDGQMEFQVARELCRRGLPFLFLTCFQAGVVPIDLAHVPMISKPVDLGLVLLLTRDLLRGPRRH